MPKHTATPIADAVQADRPIDGRPSVVEDAFAFVIDRLDRLEHMLGSLNGTVMRAGTVLEPLLTDGSYTEPSYDPPTDTETTPEDRRSTLAKRITRLGLRADHLADATAIIERRVESILDAVEL